MSARFVIGIDFGTNTARAVVVNTADGEEVGVGVAAYPHGENGVIPDSRNPSVARHHPSDYLEAARTSIRVAVQDAERNPGFQRDAVIALGLDTTSSTTIPVDAKLRPLVFLEEFSEDLDSMAWLWKDHSSVAEAEEITAVLESHWPEQLARIGGAYSSEWFWSKLLRFARVAPRAFAATFVWIEIADWLVAWLTGGAVPDAIVRGTCMAGHKALHENSWGGGPPIEFLHKIDPQLIQIRNRLNGPVVPVGEFAGVLTEERAQWLGLPPGIPVGIPEIDAHIGALGSGIREGRMAKIMGTSGVDLVVTPRHNAPGFVPGVSGVVPDSILPGYTTIEAGQSAVGDIYGWFVTQIRPGGGMTHDELTEKAGKLRAGESGLLSLDWMNGNRTVLIDQRLTGVILGLNLRTPPAHIYRALIEATAFGSRVILDRFEEHGLKIDEIVTSGGLPVRNSFVMQVFADILERPLKIARSDQTSALGSAIAAAAAADRLAGRPVVVSEIVGRMTGFRNQVFRPDARNVPIYRELYPLFRDVHDSFGVQNAQRDLYSVMKKLIGIRTRVMQKNR
jgi:L-ribulokinase